MSAGCWSTAPHSRTYALELLGRLLVPAAAVERDAEQLADGRRLRQRGAQRAQEPERVLLAVGLERVGGTRRAARRAWRRGGRPGAGTPRAPPWAPGRGRVGARHSSAARTAPRTEPSSCPWPPVAAGRGLPRTTRNDSRRGREVLWLAASGVARVAGSPDGGVASAFADRSGRQVAPDGRTSIARGPLLRGAPSRFGGPPRDAPRAPVRPPDPPVPPVRARTAGARAGPAVRDPRLSRRVEPAAGRPGRPVLRALDPPRSGLRDRLAALALRLLVPATRVPRACGPSSRRRTADDLSTCRPTRPDGRSRRPGLPACDPQEARPMTACARRSSPRRPACARPRAPKKTNDWSSSGSWTRPEPGACVRRRAAGRGLPPARRRARLAGAARGGLARCSAPRRPGPRRARRRLALRRCHPTRAARGRTLAAAGLGRASASILAVAAGASFGQRLILLVVRGWPSVQNARRPAGRRDEGAPIWMPPRTRNPGGDLLSQGAAPQVPSARAVFTSVFGMGTGVSPPQLPPETWISKSEFQKVCRPSRTP